MAVQLSKLYKYIAHTHTPHTNTHAPTHTHTHFNTCTHTCTTGATVQCGYPHSVLCSTDPLPECEASIYDQWQDTSWAGTVISVCSSQRMRKKLESAVVSACTSQSAYAQDTSRASADTSYLASAVVSVCASK